MIACYNSVYIVHSESLFILQISHVDKSLENFVVSVDSLILIFKF